MHNRTVTVQKFLLSDTSIGSFYLNGYWLKTGYDIIKYVSQLSVPRLASSAFIHFASPIAGLTQNDYIIEKTQVAVDCIAAISDPLAYGVMYTGSLVGDSFLDFQWNKLTDKQRQSAAWQEFFAILHIAKIEAAKRVAKKTSEIGTQKLTELAKNKAPNLMNYIESLQTPKIEHKNPIHLNVVEQAAERRIQRIREKIRQEMKDKEVRRKVLIKAIEDDIPNRSDAELQALFRATLRGYPEGTFEMNLIMMNTGLQPIIAAHPRVYLDAVQVARLRWPTYQEQELRKSKCIQTIVDMTQIVPEEDDSDDVLDSNDNSKKSSSSSTSENDSEDSDESTLSFSTENDSNRNLEGLESISENSFELNSSETGNVSVEIPYRTLIRGETLGGVKILSGGYSAVYHGQFNEKPVAIKVISLDEIEEDFKREATLMAKLKNPRIISFHGFSLDSANQRYALVMEYMPKGSLFRVLSNGEPLEWKVRYQMGIDVGEGLVFLHDKDIIHAELKSSNIMVDDHNRAFIADFGFAKIKNKNSSLCRGSENWLAPELLDSNAKTTKASDVYSYGMILWALGAKKTPYSSISKDHDVAEKIRNHETETIAIDTPLSMANWITKCWAADPAKRPEIKTIVKELQDEYANNYKNTSRC